MPTAEWIKCTSSDGEAIRINIALAIVIEPHKKGTRVRFIGEDHVDLEEEPDQIYELCGLAESKDD